MLDALGGTRARVGLLVPLLANHGIVLAHAALDAEAVPLGGRLMMPPGHLSRLRRAVESERLE